jgi:hypothetical protein
VDLMGHFFSRICQFFLSFPPRQKKKKKTGGIF